jgi:hypothetical protein
MWLMNVANRNLADCFVALTAGTTVMVAMHPIREMYRESVDIIGNSRWTQLNNSAKISMSWYVTNVIHGDIMLMLGSASSSDSTKTIHNPSFLKAYSPTIELARPRLMLELANTAPA